MVVPKNANNLSPREKRKTLRALNLIKEKRNGNIKGRTCADGISQRQYLKQDESVDSPTASLESLLVTLLIDAYENRDSAISGVLGAYLQVDFLEGSNNERVLSKLPGEFIDIMCEVNPKHSPNVVFEKEKRYYT